MASKKKIHGYDQTVFLLQGGGALGSYQGGVCEGLLDEGIEPDWIVGTSIGAINSAIIAGNKPENRVKKLKEFWRLISSPISISTDEQLYLPFQEYQKSLSALWTLIFGQDGFFKPRLISPIFNVANFPNQISFYELSELEKTLEKLVDFDLINKKKTRLMLGAVCLENSNQVFFDNFKQEITPKHVMASGALPPGFPAVSIDRRSYWDGGLKSNTPLYAILSENKPEQLLCILVHLFSYRQRLPASLLEVTKRKKDLEFSSRYHEVLKYLCEIHELKYAIHKLLENGESKKVNKRIQKIGALGQGTLLNISRFHYTDHPSDLWSKDFEFSFPSLQEHWENGYNDVKKAFLKPEKWLGPVPADKGIILHEL